MSRSVDLYLSTEVSEGKAAPRRHGITYIRRRPFRGPDGPRGDPASPLVLPPRVRREPPGRRLRRRHPDRLRADAARSRETLRRREDVARPRRRGAVGRVPGPPPLRAVQRPRVGFLVVVRTVSGGVRGVRPPRRRRAARRPRGRLRETTTTSAARREGARPRPVRLRRRRPRGGPRHPGVVGASVLLRGRAPRTPRHHRYYAGPSSGRERRRLPDREET